MDFSMIKIFSSKIINFDSFIFFTNKQHNLKNDTMRTLLRII